MNDLIQYRKKGRDKGLFIQENEYVSNFPKHVHKSHLFEISQG